MQSVEAAGPAAASMLLGVVAASIATVAFITDAALETIANTGVADVGGLIAGLSVGLALYHKAAKWHHEDREYLAEANRDLREQLASNREATFELERRLLKLVSEKGSLDDDEEQDS